MICIKCKREGRSVFKRVGPHFGEYCSYCDTLQKWIKKDKVDERLLEVEPKNKPLL